MSNNKRAGMAWTGRKGEPVDKIGARGFWPGRVRKDVERDLIHLSG